MPSPPISESLTSRMRSLAHLSRPVIHIALARAKPNHINTYSTADTIEGLVSLTAAQDTAFDSVQIAFTGTTKTSLDSAGNTMARSGTNASHVFLKLQQPIDEESYPRSRIAIGGKTYRFPFTFVVPDQLLPRSCRHYVAHPKVKDSHLQLPPSLGDKEVLGGTPAGLDDLAPDMVKIVYAVEVKVVGNGRADKTALVEKQQKVKIIPASEELPPLNIASDEDEYKLRSEKKIKRGLLNGKVGSLVMETAQPAHLQLPPASATRSPPPTTMATVILRYDPSEDRVELPRLGVLSSKLKVHTFYSSTAFQDVPSRSKLAFDPHHAVHSGGVSLSSRDVQAVQWQRHAPHTSTSAAILRRDSSMTAVTTSCPEPSSTYSADKPFYTTQIIIPITLPSNKSFVPSFQTCLASRTYALDLALSVSVPGGIPGSGSTLHLKVPLQISARSNLTPTRTLTMEEIEEIEAAQVDEFFTPRSFGSASEPSYQLAQANSRQIVSESPPEYSHFSHGAPPRQRRSVSRTLPGPWTLAAAAVTMVR